LTKILPTCILRVEDSCPPAAQRATTPGRGLAGGQEIPMSEVTKASIRPSGDRLGGQNLYEKTVGYGEMGRSLKTSSH